LSTINCQIYFKSAKTVFVQATILVCALFALAACANFSSGIGDGADSHSHIVVQGSDTMEKMVRAWAKAFIKLHPEVKIEVRSGDTGSGIEQLISAKINLAAASRQLTADEHTQAHDKGVHLSRTMVAKDSVAIIVGPQNLLEAITIDELKGVFSGRITKWTELKNVPELKDKNEIVVLGREASSGTGDYLREHILGGQPFGPRVKLMASSESVIEAVEKQKEAIGFVGMSQAERAGSKIKVVKLLLDASSPQNSGGASITGADYPLSRPLYLYCNVAGDRLTKTFVEFCQSDEGQKIVKDMGFVSVR